MSEIPVSCIIEQARAETVDFTGAMDDFEYLLENGDVLLVSIPLTSGPELGWAGAAAPKLSNASRGVDEGRGLGWVAPHAFVF